MAGGDGKTIRCTICHGPTLKGLGEVPSITGRPATYIFRQLNDMQTGNRSGPWVELMKQVVEKLDPGRHDRTCRPISDRSNHNGLVDSISGDRPAFRPWESVWRK